MVKGEREKGMSVGSADHRVSGQQTRHPGPPRPRASGTTWSPLSFSLSCENKARVRILTPTLLSVGLRESHLMSLRFHVSSVQKIKSAS